MAVGLGGSAQLAGSITYEMLCGEPPHRGDTPRAILARKISGETTSIRALRPSVTEEVDQAVLKALEVVPGDRPGTAAEFAAALGSARALGPSRASASRPRPRRRAVLGGVVIAAALVAPFALLQGIFGPESTSPSSAPSAAAPEGARDAGTQPSIAVLPFESLSGQPEDEPFVRGIHDEVVAQLGKIRSLDVRSLTSVLQYRDSPKNLRTIGEELGVEFIVGGSVRRGGGITRITVALHDAQADRRIWGDSYNSDLSVAGVLDIQPRLALEIASRLGAEILPNERARLDVDPPVSLLAYERYLEGLFHLREITIGEGTGADRRLSGERAEEALCEAIEEDPEWAPASAALGTVRHWTAESKEDFDRSRALLEQPLQIDSLHAPAWNSLAYARFGLTPRVPSAVGFTVPACSPTESTVSSPPWKSVIRVA